MRRVTGLHRASPRTALCLGTALLTGGVLLARQGCRPADGGSVRTTVPSTPPPAAPPAVLTSSLQPALRAAAGIARRQHRDDTARSDTARSDTARSDTARGDTAGGDAGAPAHVAQPAPLSSLPPDNPERLAALLTARLEPRTLALLSEIERELKRAPPAELHALIAAQRRGAGRAELLERARRDLPRELLLRGLVVRWINEVAPDPDAKPVAAPAAPGTGTGRWLTPLRRM